MPCTTSTDLTPRTVRSRTSSNPCFIPNHVSESVRIDVVRKVRRSTRPWPLSIVVATEPGGGGLSPGGSGRRDGSGGGLEAESGPDIRGQGRLILLRDQDIIAPRIDDLCGQVPLAEHGIAKDHLACEG
jgi:hypothetical protein